MKNYYAEVVDLVAKGGFVSATKYVSPKLVVRATRRRFGPNRRFDKYDIDITVKIGKPNYLEREFVSDYKKAGGVFPVEDIVVKYYNPKPSNNLRPRKKK